MTSFAEMIRARDQWTIEDAIANLYEVFDTVEGYPWTGQYDLAILQVGRAYLRSIGIDVNDLLRTDWPLVRYSTPNPNPTLPKKRRLAIFERDDFTCKHCGETDDLTVDHIVPRSKGGDDSDENLQTLCRSCNSRKGPRI